MAFMMLRRWFQPCHHLKWILLLVAVWKITHLESMLPMGTGEIPPGVHVGAEMHSTFALNGQPRPA